VVQLRGVRTGRRVSALVGGTRLRALTGGEADHGCRGVSARVNRIANAFVLLLTSCAVAFAASGFQDEVFFSLGGGVLVWILVLPRLTHDWRVPHALLHSANVSPQINRFLPYPRVRAHAARQLLTRARGCLSWMTSGPGVPLPLLGDGARASGEPRFMLLLRAPRTGLDKDRPLFPLVMQNLQVSRGLVRVKDPCAPLAPGLGECNLLSGIL
jgi:hypothetical protein